MMHQSMKFHECKTHFEDVPDGFMFWRKIIGMKQYLNTISNQEDIVYFVDTVDVLFDAFEDEIISAYEYISKREGKPVIVSAEGNCAPWPNMTDLFPVLQTSSRFLNSGMYMGTVAGLKKVFNGDFGIKMGIFDHFFDD
jgi:hypothetical protein